MRLVVLKHVSLFLLVGLCSSAPAESGESLNDLNELFTCNNKERVPMDAPCNMTVECSDGSDESALNCMPESRESDYFYCSYGLMLDMNRVCNGVFDCLDGSDEYPHYCKYHNATDEEKTKMDEGLSGHCGADKFQCELGECIQNMQRCDGHIDCSNGLDETPEICLRATCPDTLYTCAYGACVNGEQVCDGVIDCVDGSDEIFRKPGCNLTELIPGPTKGNLIVAKYEDYCHVPPRNKLFINGRLPLDSKNISHITHISLNSGINFKCENGYNSLDDLSILYFVCGENNSWNIPPPKCIRQCSDIRSDVSVSLSCTYQERTTNCGQLLAGTIVSVNCAHGYRQSKNYRRYLTCKADGEWSDNADPDLTNDVCEQTCGQIEKPQETYSIKGYKAKTYQLPWHIALYNAEEEHKSKYLCSGSIISANWVLTAAHCVVNVDNEDNLPQMFVVIANKQYKNYAQTNTDHNSEMQLRNLSSIYTHEKYEGDATGHRYDVALLNVSQPFIFDTRISPICGPTEEMLISSSLKRDKSYFASYSSTDNGEIARLFGFVYSNQEKHTLATFKIDRPGFAEKGDSGGGIYIENIDSKIVYIRGLLSTGDGSVSSVVSISDLTNRELVNWVRAKVSVF